MANIEITNCDIGSVELEGGQFRDELVTVAGATTLKKGTVLARRLVALAVAAAANAGNTGNGTVTAATVVEGPEVPLVGVYKLSCTAAVVNGGNFKLEDPNGRLVAAGLAMTVGAGAATIFEVGGLRFTLTDGATDFAAGDFFNLTVAADGKLVPYDPAGAGGTQVPSAVLTYEVVAAGAGDVAIRALIAGRVNATRLVIHVDGDGSNITAAILDQLRGRGITALPVKQLSKLDNQ